MANKIVFIGAQGSGKGTQAKIISEKLKIPHISTGDLLREATGELKKQANSYMNSGKLVPDELILKLLKERLAKEDTKKGFILDGFPRNLEQAKKLDKITKIDKVIEIFIPDDEAIKRISGRVSCEVCKAGFNLLTSPQPKKPWVCDFCGGKLVAREDDNPKAVKKRLEIYHKETEPILKYYNSIKVNGQAGINEIAEEILRVLKN
jgi:adenylate kinase